MAVLWDESVLRKYLVRTHSLTQLALIAHQGCGVYRAWLRVPPDAIAARQHADLRAARARITQSLPGLAVHLFFAEVAGDGVSFAKVEWPPGRGYGALRT